MTVALLRTSTNNAPTVANTIPNQSAMVGTVFNYTVPDDTFTDADSDTLTYAATLDGGNELPSWLSFTAATRAFSGTPTAAQTVSVQVTASDGNGGSVSDFFDIVVSADTTTSVSGALVSNLNQSATSGAILPVGLVAISNPGGQMISPRASRPGRNAAGYTLTSIEIPFAEDISAADIADLTVSIHADDGSGNPAATALFTLDNPASIDGNTGFGGSIPADRVAATHEFTVPAANTTTTFTMSTDYFVVLTYDQDVGIWYVEGDSWDSGAAPGWTIATRSRYKRGSGSWTANPVGVPLMIRVNGTTAGGTNAAPTVANPIGPDGDGGHGVQLYGSGQHVRRHGRRRHADLHGHPIRRFRSALVAEFRRRHAHVLGHADDRERGDARGEGDGERRHPLGQRHLRHRGLGRHHHRHLYWHVSGEQPQPARDLFSS